MCGNILIELSQLSSDMNNQILSIIFSNNIDIELIKKQTNTNWYILVKGNCMKDIYQKIEANIELQSIQFNYVIGENFTIKTSDLIFIQYLISQIISLYSIKGKIKYEFLKRSILL